MAEVDKKLLEATVKSVLGSADREVVSVVQKIVSRGYDRRKIKERLSECVRDSRSLSKLTDKILDELINKNKGRKRPKFEEFPSERNASSSLENGANSNKKQRHSPAKTENGSLPDKPSTSDETPKVDEVDSNTNAADSNSDAAPQDTPKPDFAQQLKIKEIMAQAQKAIEERKRQLNIPQAKPAVMPLNKLEPGTSAQPVIPVQEEIVSNVNLAPTEATQYLQMAMDKAKRTAELKAKLAEKLPSTLQSLHARGVVQAPIFPLMNKSKAEPMPGKLVLDKDGLVDATSGRPLSLAPIHTIKANIRAERRDIFRRAELELKMEQEGQQKLMQHAAQGDEAAAGAAPQHLDERIGAKPAVRQRRGFNFHSKGEFEKLANRQRAVAKLELLQGEIAQKAKRTGISSAVKLAMVAPRQRTGDQPIPDVEWWDMVLMPDTIKLNGMSEEEIANLDLDEIKMIGNLVEHPTQLKPPDDPLEPQYLKVFLTKQEQKKLRRQTRKDVLREKTEKIRLGLEPPPEPKMKISNLMRVLGTDAIKDPTKMEQYVRAQMAKRLKKHEEANAARKLTKEQKAAKKAKKLSEDVSLGVHVTVYRITDLSNMAKKFKVEQNAKQLGMSGVAVLHGDCNVLVVEGGPKQHKFYKNLMMNRIKWSDDKVPGDDPAHPRRNSCCIVWTGVVKRRNFGKMNFVKCTLEKQAREHFERHGVPQYWHNALAGKVLEGEDDDL